MDGLLGIGAAGGRSGSKANEGAMMAARLESMRQERDNRAKMAKKAPATSAAAVEPLQFDDGVQPLQFDESAATDVAVMETERVPKKQKKKKKKKNKK